MQDVLQRKYSRVRRALALQRPDRMPVLADDLGSVEYRKDVYHLGEPEFVAQVGQVAVSEDGTRKYTKDGGVWAVGDTSRYRDCDDVLRVRPDGFEVEEVGPVMLDQMTRLLAERASSCFPVPLHYGTLVTRAVLEFGWEPFLLASAVDPPRLGRILDRLGEASLAVARGWARTAGAELILIHDDIAGTRGVLMDPQWYREYVFPWYRRIFSAVHEQGRKVLYISDGNYLDVLDDLLALSPDGLYVESTSMDPAQLMGRAGRDKLYLVKSDSRNIDFGTPDDIRAELVRLRALHANYPGMMMYRGGGNPRPGNAEAYDRYFQELLVYEG